MKSPWMRNLIKWKRSKEFQAFASHLWKASCSALLRFGSGGFGIYFFFLVNYFSNPEYICTQEM